MVLLELPNKLLIQANIPPELAGLASVRVFSTRELGGAGWLGVIPLTAATCRGLISVALLLTIVSCSISFATSSAMA